MKFRKHYVLLFLSMFISWMVSAQSVTVNGTIKDGSGEPVPGATILVKGTTQGTTSDFDGKYQIDVSSEGILVFSFVGFTTVEEPVNGRAEINVTLNEDAQALEEVVVVGYGTQKKSVVTGAISSIKQSDLEDLPITRVEQSLQGRASGLTIASNSGQPGSSSTIRVRGITTLNNNNPLWVVDGVVVDNGGIGYLNQADIESIEVLKDGASAAIYGSRAATGVILVTTKKGKAGKMNINYNGYVGVSSPSRKLDLLNATEYATLRNEASVAGGGSILFANPESYGQGTDWQEEIFNNSAIRQSNELSLSGGNEKSTFYVSFGLTDQEGIVATKISNYIRQNIRLNSTHKITDKITFGQTAAYSHEKVVGIGNTNSEYGGPLASAINLDPLTPVVETDPVLANQAPYNNAGIFRNTNGDPYAISSFVGQEMSNPLAYIQTRLGNYQWSDNLVGNAYVEIEPIEGLKVRSTVGGKLAYWGEENFTPVSYLNSAFVVGQNNINKQTNRGFAWNIENTVSYEKSIEDHNFTALLGQGTYVEGITGGSSVTYYDIPTNDYREAAFVSGHPADKIQSYAYDNYSHSVYSLFGRLNYNYKEKYMFTGIVRRDGSTKFGDNNKYGYFPSFSAGWNPLLEDFWPENNVVNQLKIRGGYGVVGNDSSNDFLYLATIGSGRNYPIGTAGSVVAGNSPNAPSNPDLKWEETSQLNIGFDARFFQYFSFTFDYYNKKTTGILQQIVLPGYIGTTGNPWGNVADMENKGVDLELGYSKTFEDFKVSANANIGYVKNEVTFLGNGVDFLTGGESIQSSTYPITRTQVGQPYSSFYGFKTDGIFQNQAEIDAYTNTDGSLIQPNAVPGDFRYVNVDGKGTIDSDDRTFIGNPLPDFTFGFTVNLSYKNFDFMAFAQGAAGNQIYQALRRLDIGSANYQTNALNRWTGEGTSNSYPRLTTNDTNLNFSNPSDFYLEDGDYLRFKTIQLGYTLPNSIIDKVGLSKVRLYITGENLFTFTKYSGFDPEIGGNVLGIDRGYYPQAKTGMLGINVQF
ncbi:TonB-dependent receptor [Aureibaculum algae]|uniref:TonB-dependent receptor n=1 Tax=Aureibaculum algae TaxID=2584122 RepID=A0A5B7TUH2_9FLAO|nr:TonB-dependent receptor [Aureibaculum algae]QCX38282.1 TonB-dependent receptor [Aureibaculum algae]